MTPEQEKGTRFEIWLHQLICRLGYPDAQHNVEFHRERYVFRQVDVAYDIVRGQKRNLVLCEAKFSSNGHVHYKLRKPVQKAGQMIRINNLVDEVYERQLFVGAAASVLVTNKEFDADLRKEAEKRGIQTIERVHLQQYYRRVGGHGSIDDSINKVRLGKTRKNIIYL